MAGRRRKVTKKTDPVVDALKDLLIVQLALVRVPGHAIREVAVHGRGEGAGQRDTEHSFGLLLHGDRLGVVRAGDDREIDDAVEGAGLQERRERVRHWTGRGRLGRWSGR